ncbi:M23 family metallopeptidase [Acinetobacter pittii]|uniref:M23 family metallopeptidase n=1 Tax=Acinetobacter pittii TaxID=48296 RepID=UPI001EFE5A5B|nr:M23 family metallopeptidase [Acinetobacter pittii]MCG9491561.1 M23 family metallopeptidase [Acinetobacter pittii]
MKYKRYHPPPVAASHSLLEQFGIRGLTQIGRDLHTILREFNSAEGSLIDLSVVHHARPRISIPAYMGLIPDSGVAPIMNYFDRTVDGHSWERRVTKKLARDWRGGQLTYDGHDGTDFACPPRMAVVAAAPGVLVAVRDTFLRGGLTACVDHGNGVITQYTHLTKMVATIGQPLQRGDVLAWSGTAGLDMVSGFPWVAPHIHFMVWINGKPVDPFRRKDEPLRRVGWLRENEPETSGPLANDRPPLTLSDVSVNEAALEQVIAQCANAAIHAELSRAAHPATRLAIVEDSLQHDAEAWPQGLSNIPLRLDKDDTKIKLTMPLPASEYRTARPYDNFLSRPK